MLNFRNDPDSFKNFITAHQNRVFNLVLNKVQHLQDAEEITQDVFVDVYKKPESFRGDSSVSTWLYRIAINKCIDHLRKKQRTNRWTGLGRTPLNEKYDAKEFYHPGIAAENRENAILLFKAMKKLPEKQQTAWILSEMENCSYKQISEVMNISLSSVESLLFRARQNLRKILHDLT